MSKFTQRTLLVAVLFALLAGVACSQPVERKSTPASEPLPKPTFPAEVSQAAESALGAETEVLAYGDLAHTSHEQVLAVNRLKKTPPGTVPGILVTRAVILEKDGGKWKEIFRADEHLKNPNGYLGSTPIAPVATWRLQYEQHADVGLAVYFTPLEKPAGGYIITIGVRWNPKVMRYQSLDRNYEHFLGEVPLLEQSELQLHR